jgi:Cys-tRNA(Pro)/Cys-tRNA(Cys) deacylase
MRGAPAFARLLALVEQSGLAFSLHEHPPTRTMQDAADSLDFDPRRIIKTIAFRTRDGRLVLAALRGTRRGDYAKLAACLGLGRRDLSALSPQEVLESLGVAPGSVSPLPLVEAEILMDADALAIAPTAYCGLGRPDRTLEIAPADLLTLAGAQSAEFSRPTASPGAPPR